MTKMMLRLWFVFRFITATVGSRCNMYVDKQQMSFLRSTGVYLRSFLASGEFMEQVFV